MVNGQTTSLNKANKTSASLRTTVPSGIIKQFELEEGDHLAWKIGHDENKDFIVVVRPMKKE